jgi:hypothetical protein
VNDDAQVHLCAPRKVSGSLIVKLCSSCGVGNDDDAVFCVSCNYFLEWTEDPAQTAGPVRPTPVPTDPRRPAAAQPAAAQPAVPSVVRNPAAPPPTALPAEPPPPTARPSAPVAQPANPSRPPATAVGSAQRPPTGPDAARPPQAAPSRARQAPAPAAASPANPATETDDFAPEQRLVGQAMAGLERGRELAIARDRSDLAQTLDGARQRLDHRTIGVAIVGEFKRGKSTLVNALLQTAVCPVDADEVTVVPTIVRYGDTPSATALFEAPDVNGEPSTESVRIEEVAQWVSETGNPGNRRGLRSMEVRLPRRFLRTGLCLIDTPGVGGLDSAHGIITLGALDQADGMLFVTDASQELTEPELDFLRQALARCPRAACVVTKTDLYPHWRRIVEINEGHLRRAGLDLPVIGVSSFLRLAARRDPALLEESGYAGLVEFLGRGVIRAANAQAAEAAARDVGFVSDQIGQQIQAERAVLTEPARAQEVVDRLAIAQDRTAGLLAPTATWQQVLSDGVQDLVADVEHDLQGRLRTVLRDVENIIDAGDPKDSWTDIEVWLRRHVVAAAVANYDTLAERTRDLATDVSERFSLDAGGPVLLDVAPPADVSGVNLAAVESLSAPGGRFGPMMLATRSAMFVPMVLFGVAGSLLGISTLIAAPLSVVLAAGIGQKIIRDEKKRQVAHRRQQAKMAARRYVEEVGFIMNKESRDALRRTQRFLRDDFQQRATSLHRSSTSALGAAQQAMQLAGPQRSARVAQLSSEADQLRAVDAQVAQLVGAAAAPGGRRG